MEITIKNITILEWQTGKQLLMNETSSLEQTNPIHRLLNLAIESFEKEEWSYDGATFVQERYKTHIWEVAAFIHDWRNSNGYVGKAIDEEFFSIMKILQYPTKKFVWRWFLCRFTFLNRWRHQLLKSYISTNPPDIYGNLH